MSYYAGSGFIEIHPAALNDALANPTVQRFIVIGHGPLSVLGSPTVGRILLAHGAGAGHCSVFMRQFAAMLQRKAYRYWQLIFPTCSRLTSRVSAAHRPHQADGG